MPAPAARAGRNRAPADPSSASSHDLVGMRRSRAVGNNTNGTGPDPIIRRNCAQECGCASCRAERGSRDGGEASQTLGKLSSLHTKLQIGRSDDPAERRADARANDVLSGRSASGPIRRSAKRETGGIDVPPEAETGLRHLQSGGSHLPDAVRTRMEPAFGRDFGDVRIHRDASAAATADKIGAKAFAMGNHIAFNQGTFAPGTPDGDHLIAHELAHVEEETAMVRRSPLDWLSDLFGGGDDDEEEAPESETTADDQTSEASSDEWDPFTDEYADPDQMTSSRAPPYMSDGELSDAIETLQDELDLALPEETIDIEDELDQLEDEEYLRSLISADVVKVNGMSADAVLEAVELLEAAQETNRPDQDDITDALDLFTRKEETPEDPIQRIPEDAVSGIKPYGLLTVAMLPIFPSSAKISTKDVVRRGDYTLVPHSREASDGTLELLYYLAYRNGPEDFDYIVGPGALSKFVGDVSGFEDEADESLGQLTADEIIDKHTGWINLDEGALGRELLKLAARQKPRLHRYVIDVINALDDGDRDDVAVGFFESATDKQLVSFVRSESGRPMIDRLYDELVGQGGYVGDDEEKQGKRVVLARSLGVLVDDFEEQAETAYIFPFRLSGFTVFDDAPILAKRLANGNVHVEMPVRVMNTKKFKAETRTLPTEVFLSGIELPPDQIVGVRSYEEGGRLEFIPAIGLIGYAGQGTTNVYNKIGESAAIAATFGFGGAALGGAGAVSWGARALVWIDRAAAALMLLQIAVSEHRGWIVNTFPKAGPKFIRAVEIANSAAAIYGLTRLAIEGVKLAIKVRNARTSLNKEAADLVLNSDDAAKLREIDEPAEAFLKNIDEARSKQGLDPLGDLGEAAAKGEVPKLGKINEKTEALFKAKPALKEALQKNSKAAKFLKNCNSPCYPENMTASQIERLENILDTMPPEINVNSEKLSAALKKLDEAEISKFLDRFEDEVMDRAEMLSDLGKGGLDDADDLIDEGKRNRSGVRGTGDTPGRALGNALRRAGELPPGPGYHAHHIVPKSARRMIEKLSERTGVKQNEVLNGVWLPENAKIANQNGSLLHLDYIHRNHSGYIKEIERRLLGADDMLAELATIKREMLDGIFRY